MNHVPPPALPARARRPRFARFRDLTPDLVNVEMQVHTTQTDGSATVDELLDAAVAMGIGSIAFTEHVRRDTDWFSAFRAGILAIAPAYPTLDVYVGCEAKAMDFDGGFDAGEQLLAECDIVLGSVHRFPDGNGGFLDFASLGATELGELECRLAVGLLRRAPIDVLAHPGGMYQRRHGAYPPHLMRRLLVASLERDVAVEINASYLVDVPGFLELCSEVNPLVSIGSDVHRLEEVGRCRDTLMRAMGW